MKIATASLALALATLPALPAAADPAVGFGITIVSTGEVAIGLRLFSDNRPGRAAAAIGLDYKLRSQSLRPTLGVAWLEDEFYADLSLGYDTKAGQVDFGAGIGVAGNMRTPAPAAGGGGTGTGGGTGGTGTDAARSSWSF
jgi:hypothetical protein